MLVFSLEPMSARVFSLDPHLLNSLLVSTSKKTVRLLISVLLSSNHRILDFPISGNSVI